MFNSSHITEWRINQKLHITGGKKMFSKNMVYHNPVTGEYASEFIHNIKHTIVTNDMTICDIDGNKASKLLVQLGFTKQVAYRPSIGLNTIREQMDDYSGKY
jgi:hypothetical protein